MKRLLQLILLLSVLSSPAAPGFAQTITKPSTLEEESYFGLPLCLPGMQNDGTCLFYGPAQTVAAMAEAGFPYPPRELPAAHLPADYGEMPVFIARVNLPENEPAPIYGSFEDAVAGVNPVDQIAPGRMRWISYVTRQDHNKNPYLQLASGGWMRASPAAYTNFRGLLFYENPRNDFGWIISETPSYHEPSFDAPTYERTYYREELIQVYSTVEAEGVTWYQIAPDEWVNQHKARVVSLNLHPPEGVAKSSRWIEINLLQQTFMVYEDGRLLFATLTASGIGAFSTRPGIFDIDEMKPLETMQGSFEADRSDFFYFQDVPWTIYFDGANAIHAAYWGPYLGIPQSHGCINLSPGDAHWVFEWAEEGDHVWVHDPSGQTPTDPESSSPGGA